MFSHDNAGRNFLNPFNYSIVEEIYFSNKYEEDLGNDKLYRDELLKQYIKMLNEKIELANGKSFVDKYQWLKEFAYYTLENKYNDKFGSGLSVKQ